MKKILAIVLTVAMMLSLVSFASAEGFSGDIKVWVADAVVDFTKEQVEAFKAANPEYADMTVAVEPVGEGDAANNMITDVESGADIFGFAQDQLARLVAAGALIDVGRGYLSRETIAAAVKSGDRSLLSLTAPAMGLCLIKIYYDDEYFLDKEALLR